MTGKLIAIEGIDGVGKGTQAKLLLDRILASGKRAELLSFPRYAETVFGGLVGEYLNGRFGTLDEVHPFLASLLFSGDRFESRQILLDALETNDIVICDRYVTSNIAHQAAKLDAVERDTLIRRIETVEYGVFRIPRADATIYLDLPVTLAQMLIAAKSKRAYTDLAADLHEADPTYLNRVRDVYALVMERMPGEWQIVNCARSHQVRSRDEIGEEIWSWYQML